MSTFGKVKLKHKRTRENYNALGIKCVDKSILKVYKKNVDISRKGIVIILK